jgi:rare lipoprotein A
MKWNASPLALLLLAAPAGAQQAPDGPPQGSGPQGSSQQTPGQERYDEVGYAGIGEGAGVTAAHRSLAPGTFVEVTALDTGRTIVAVIADRGAEVPGHIIDLSPAAASQLGTAGLAPVRVRKMTPTPQEQSTLRQGQPASERIDAPPALLTALRKRLPAMPRGVAAAPVRAAPVRAAPVRSPPRAVEAPGASYARPDRPETVLVRPSTVAPVRAAPPPPAPVAAGYFVQVAAVSDSGRAQGLANSLGGFVKGGGGVFRVQIGPFPDPVSAERARAEAARRGYGDARIFRQ